MVLPVTLVHHDQEAPIDFVARLALANGFASLRDFLDHTDTSARAIVVGDACALSNVAEWSGVPMTRLARWSVTGNGVGATWRMGCATLSKDMRVGRRMRFCAKCVLDDRASEGGRLAARSYRRVWWNTRGVDGCHIHSCRLAEFDVSVDVDLADFPGFIKANLPIIEETAKAAPRSTQPMLDQFLIARIDGRLEEGFTQKLEAHVVAEFCHYLGAFLKLHTIAGHHDEYATAEYGFKIVELGYEEVQRFLAETIDRLRPPTKYLERFLGPMLLWLKRNGAKAEYEPLIELVQDVLERNMPFGVGDVIFRPVTRRYVHCVRSAHLEFGLPRDRIRALMQANDPNFREELSEARTYFDAAMLRPIVEAAQETVTSRDAAVELGLTYERVHDLLKAGLLEQVEHRESEGRPFARIHRDAMRALSRGISERSKEASEKDDLLTLRQATASFGRPFHVIVSMILDGSLESFILPGGESVFLRVRVKRGALETLNGKASNDEGEEVRLQEAARILKTTKTTLGYLVEHGYLKQRTAREKKGRKVRLIERRSISEFMNFHASLSELALKKGGFRATIKAELNQLGVKPLFESDRDIATFYRRTDLANAGF